MRDHPHWAPLYEFAFGRFLRLSRPSPNLKVIAIAAILGTGLFHLVEAQDAFGDARCQRILFVANGWRELVRDADSRMAAGQFTEAQKLLEKALEADIPAEKRWTVLFMLGSAYSRTQEWLKAEATLEQSVKVAELVLGPDDSALSRITTALASAYQNDSQYEKAERYHRRSLMLQEKVLRPDDPALARFLMNVASVLNLESKEKEAEPLLRRALVIATRSDGFDRVGRAMIQDNLANSLRIQGQLDEAQALYKESLNVFRDKFGEMHQVTADVYWGLGFIAKKRGQLEAAVSLYEKAIQGFGTSAPDSAPYIKQLKSEYEQVKTDLSHSRIKE